MPLWQDLHETFPTPSIFGMRALPLYWRGSPRKTVGEGGRAILRVMQDTLFYKRKGSSRTMGYETKKKRVIYEPQKNEVIAHTINRPRTHRKTQCGFISGAQTAEQSVFRAAPPFLETKHLEIESNAFS